MHEELEESNREEKGKIEQWILRCRCHTPFGASLVAILMIIVLGTLYLNYLNQPSEPFPAGQELTIEEGTSLIDITHILKESNYIHSSLFALLLLKTAFYGSFAHAGSYTFTAPRTTYNVLRAITTGTELTPSERVRFPEGFKVADITLYLPQRFSGADVDQYLPYEGYLFPDTYEIARDDTLESIIERMLGTYTERVEHLQEKIDNSILTEEGIITFASLVQREANTVESMRMIAGILWSRLSIGMPLQVDATFHYILGKASSELTNEDLATDSPYNTYLYTGLPPSPIANPGLDAIEAVLDPIETDYLFYLTGRDGNFYYAKTFQEHKQNIAAHLR